MFAPVKNKFSPMPVDALLANNFVVVLGISWKEERLKNYKGLIYDFNFCLDCFHEQALLSFRQSEESTF